MRANPISGYFHYVTSVTKLCAPRCATGHDVSQGTLKEVMCRGALSVTGHRRVPPEPLYSHVLLDLLLGERERGQGRRRRRSSSVSRGTTSLKLWRWVRS